MATMRWTPGLAIAVLLCVVVLVLPTYARSDSAPSAANATIHPLVGSWIVSIEITMDGANEALFMFHDDGTVIATDVQDRTWYGAWAATGPRTATYSLVKAGSELRSATFYGTADVQPAGDTWVRSTTITGGPDITGIRIVAT